MIRWMETPDLRELLVVSEALHQRMDDSVRLAGELVEYGVPSVDPGLIDAIRNAIERNDIRTFSYEEVRGSDEFPDGAREICEALLENGEPLADVLADEWAFVTSQSLAGLAEQAGRALGAFTRAGATVFGVAKGRYVEALETARDKIPPPLLDAMKGLHEHVGETPMFLLAGGGVAAHLLTTAIIPPVGIGLAAVEMLLTGNAVLAGDP